MAETNSVIKSAQEKFVEKQLAKPKDYKRVFKSEAGKRVLSDMIDTHYVMRPTMGATPEITAFNEGQRQAVLRILTMLNTDEEKMKQLIEESNRYVQMAD